MRLSFVIPAYNEEGYVAACLESILEQASGLAESVEVIVVNNASTDRTGEVASRYPGVTVVHEPRKGLTAAREAGFRACTGELIANVDADSRLTPGWIEQVLATFEAEEKLIALSGPLVYYDLTPRERVLVHVFYLMAWTTYAMNRWVLRVGSMVQGGNFRRAALGAGGHRRLQYGDHLLRRRYRHRPPSERRRPGAVHLRPEDVLQRAAAEEGRHPDDGRTLLDQLPVDDLPEEAVYAGTYRYSRADAGVAA